MTIRDPLIHVRTPPDIKVEMQRVAALNRRSVNAEVVFAMEFYLRHAAGNLETAGPSLAAHPTVSAETTHQGGQPQ